MAGCRRECYGCMANEFQPTYLTLSHQEPSVFVRSQWSQFNEPYYVVYRLLIALIFLGWVVADYVTETTHFYEGHTSLWFIFATNWSFFILAISCTIEAICVPIYLWKPRDDKSMPIYLCIHWFFYTVASNTALVITVCYWVFLIGMDSSDFLATPMSQAKHTANTVYVLLNLFIVATPIRFLHVIYVIGLEVIYVVFNAIYFLHHGEGPEGKPYAYAILKWAKEPFEATFFSFVVFVASILSQIVLCGLFTLRDSIANGTLYGNYGDDTETAAILDNMEGGDYSAIQTEMKDMSKEPSQ